MLLLKFASILAFFGLTMAQVGPCYNQFVPRSPTSSNMDLTVSQGQTQMRELETIVTVKETVSPFIPLSCIITIRDGMGRSETDPVTITDLCL